ncbi:MAG: hypothetical protein JSR83_00355 [Proteobacteria bacterium]|uniref:hypothetical protein n=1 Tax=Zoogloea sp. LCSB751 TaxID=1965277 RepID=UPI001116C909|nr:hypothetical protein [Zoogloea sp. LCSB751]MBS0352347.1 hypothetical protein [Pseudomonadota bacterium]
MKRSLGMTLAGVALVLSLGACSSTPITPPVAELPEFISNASTPADHQRIADYFAKKAAGYDAEAKQHDRMAVAYSGRPKGDAGLWASHCSALRLKLKEAAQEARVLEKAHRDAAASLSQ